MEDHVTRAEFEEACKHIEDKISDITDNHLTSIWGLLNSLVTDVSHLRWFIMGGFALLGIILGVRQILG